jgi:hypothetical protein
MKRVLIFSWLVTIGLSSFGVAGSFAEETRTQVSPRKEVVIGHLQMRDKVVTISKGEKGTVYTVKNKDGKLLDENLNEKNFQAKYPVLYDRLQDGRAGENDLWRRKSIAR